MAETAEITQVLEAIGRSEDGASEKLLPLVYAELRRLAAARMAHEVPGQTLQPTALVHEAWLRLVGDGDRTWQNRAHFFGAAAEAMRRILIERARHKSRLKHGGGQARLNIEDLELAETTPDDKVLRTARWTVSGRMPEPGCFATSASKRKRRNYFCIILAKMVCVWRISGIG